MYFIIFGSSQNMLAAAIISFGVNSGAYVAEIVRSGIMSIPKGQMEAGRSLGLDYATTMRCVIIPQAIKNILPALGNELIDLYVTLEPCPMCAGALINSRMKTVYYGAPDPKAGSCGSLINLFALPYNHQPALVSGVLEQECADILRNFFRELRKKRKEIRKLEKSRVEEQS